MNFKQTIIINYINENRNKQNTVHFLQSSSNIFNENQCYTESTSVLFCHIYFYNLDHYVLISHLFSYLFLYHEFFVAYLYFDFLIGFVPSLAFRNYVSDARSLYLTLTLIGFLFHYDDLSFSLGGDRHLNLHCYNHFVRVTPAWFYACDLGTTNRNLNRWSLANVAEFSYDDYHCDFGFDGNHLRFSFVSMIYKSKN